MNWRSCGNNGLVFVVEQEDIEWMGGGWMRGRIRPGEVCLRIGHSGDCFHQYILLEFGENFIKGIPGSEYGAYYRGGKEINWKPSRTEYNLLCAGEYITIEPNPIIEFINYCQ